MGGTDQGRLRHWRVTAGRLTSSSCPEFRAALQDEGIEAVPASCDPFSRSASRCNSDSR